MATGNATQMLFMLRMSIEIIPLAVLLPEFWVAVLVIVALAFVAHRRVGRTAPRRFAEMLLLLLLPLVILAWGLYFWPSDLASRPSHQNMALAGIRTFQLLQFGVAAWLVVRRSSQVLVVTAIACLSLLWTAGAGFVATMAVTNTWL